MRKIDWMIETKEFYRKEGIARDGVEPVPVQPKPGFPTFSEHINVSNWTAETWNNFLSYCGERLHAESTKKAATAIAAGV